MKHKLKTQLILLILLISSVNHFSQTYTSNPAVGTYTAEGSGSTFTCSFGTVSRSIIKARITNLTSTSVTFQFSRSGTFSSSGKAYIIDNSECNVNPVGTHIDYASGSSGGTFAAFNHNVAPGTTKTYYIRITPDSGTIRYITLPITITSTCSVPTGMTASNITHSGFKASWSSMPGATSYKVNYTLQSSSYPGTTVTTTTNYVNISENISGCKDYKFQVQAIYSGCESAWSGSTNFTSGTYPTPTNVTANNITSTSVKINWTAVSGGYPAYQVQSCNGSVIYQTNTNLSYDNITGLTPNTTYSMRVLTKNQGSSTCFSSPSSCVTFTTLNTVPPSPTNLTATLSGSNNASISWSQQTLTADYFKLYRSNNGPTGTYSLIYTSPNQGVGYTDTGLPNGTYYYQVEACNTVGCSARSNTSQAVVVNVASQPNLTCGSSSVSPNPLVQGSPADFSYTINNTGSGAFTGTLVLRFNSGLLTNYYDGIPAGQSRTITFHSSEVLSNPGNYPLAVYNGSTAICSTNYNVVAAPASCITWSGTPPTGLQLDAAEFLCDHSIIVNTQNGTSNHDNYITRKDLARINLLGLFLDNTPNSPAFNFPVPFNDMQTQYTGSEYWFNAAKVLSYLQYQDDKTSFGRDFTNFRPKDAIQRQYALKVFLEAFNIAPSFATPSPFTDVSTSSAMYGYIKKAHELGLISGNSTDCTTGTCYHPADNLTREQAFVILYKILTTTSISKPTLTQLEDINNYYVPANARYANFANVPGLDHGNFNHYQKTSFSIAGRGLPLEFTHTYNSLMTELPKGFFEDEDNTTPQSFSPLGIGWTHSYNIYAQFLDGNNIDEGVSIDDKLLIFYPDGSINAFNYETGNPESIGVYDTMTKIAISGGERITITTKSQVKYVFENYNNGKYYFIKSIKDRNNNGLKINWSNYTGTLYRISSVQEVFYNNSTGRSLSFTYASSTSPYMSSVTDNSINRSIQFNVDNNTKNLLSYTDPKGQITNYTYNDANNYNKSNLLTQILLPKGNKIQNTYVNRKLTSSKTFNQANVATSTTNVNWVPNYSASGYNSSATITDPQGKNTTYTHNTLGNPTQVVAPTGTTTFNNYATGNNANLPTSLTVNGQSSSISYDNKGNVLNITKNGITNAFTYNVFNEVLTHTDGRGFTTNYSYDGVGNLTSVQRPSGGGTTTISRNSFGQVQSVTNPSGITTQFGFNANGLTNQFSLPLGITTSSTYDNASRLLSTTDANGKTTSFQYDANDNLTQSTDANNQIVQHTYDANDNHLTIVNPKNETQTNTYNFDDDLLASEVFGSHTKSYTYNADGSLATHTRGNGTFTYSYDNTTGRLTSDGYTSYVYDTRGNITSITNSNGTLTLNYDNNDRMTSYSDYFGNTVSYLYDNNNNVTRITYPGNKQVNYVYDANNRCTSVTDWNNKVTSYTYLTDDRVSKITLPNGTFTDYTYDSAGRMTGIVNNKTNGTIITSYAFTMDNAGNHLTETINEPSITAGLQTVANETINYGQYPFNRIQSQGSTNFTHNTAGGITQVGSSSFTYDINDNMLTAPNSSFSYDGAGNRRAKTVGGVNTRYVLSILGMSQVLMETNSSNAVQNYYVYGPTGLLYRVKADNTTYHYYHYDYRGSTTAITNEAQNVTHSYSYDPFGKVLAKTEADTNPFQYVGQHGVQYESPTLTFMRARYYDPTTGRFVSEDPIWALNLYPYTGNNPITRIDPDGNSWIDVALDKLEEWSVNITKESSKYYTTMVDNEFKKEKPNLWLVYTYSILGGFSDIWSRDELRTMFKFAVSLYLGQKGGYDKLSKLGTKYFGKTGWTKLVDMRTKSGKDLKYITDKSIELLKEEYTDEAIERALDSMGIKDDDRTKVKDWIKFIKG